MTREARDDFQRLREFVGSYSLTHLGSNIAFNKQLQGIHNNYLSVLTFFSELKHLNKHNKVSEYNLSDNFFDYLMEFTSDIGNAIFSWIHGAYKPSKVMMRCSIENFIRAIGSLEDLGVLSETNVFRLFEIADKISLFTGSEIRKNRYESIHSYYKTLCADVHTASNKHMVHIDALKYFPHYDTSSANVIAKTIINIENICLSLLSLNFKDTFHKMHHRNKENIICSLGVDVKNYLNGM